MTIPLETTDITLFVRTSGEDIVRWNRQSIVEALIRETGVDVDTAEMNAFRFSLFAIRLIVQVI